MRKLFHILIVMLFVMGIVFSYVPLSQAQIRYSLQISQPLESDGIFTGQDGNAMDYGVWVYGVKIYADASSSFAGYYDCDTTAELLPAARTTLPAKDEIGEATQYDSYTDMYPKPIYYSDGVGALVDTGVAYVIYGPEPAE